MRERVPKPELLDVAGRLDRLLEDLPPVADALRRLPVGKRHAGVSEVVEREAGNRQGARENDSCLDKIGVDDCGKPADGRIDAGEQDRRDGADPERRDRRAADRELHLGHHHLEEQRAREDGDGNLRKNVRCKRDEGENPPGLRAEAPLKELRHGRHA